MLEAEIPRSWLSSTHSRLVNCGPRSEVRHPEARDPVTDEGSRTGLCSGVRKWNGLRPSSEAIDDREEV